MTSYLSLLPITLLLAAVARSSNVSTTKPGLAWAGAPSQAQQFLQAGTISWYYHWSEWPTIDQNIEFVPMLWGERDVESWTKNIDDILSRSNVTHLLAFNEPNLASQANMSVERAVELWKTYIQPYKTSHNLTLVSPVPTNGPTGPVWLKNFTDLCGPECTIDIIALHYYGTNADYLIKYVEDVHNMFNKSIWLTEFACQSFVNQSDVASPQDVSLFMNKTVDFLESTEWVERYSWFGAMTSMPGMNPLNAMMDSQGLINYLGLQYIGLGTWSTNGSDAGNSSVVPPADPGSKGSPTFVPSPNATHVSQEDNGGWPRLIDGAASSLHVDLALLLLAAAAASLVV